MCSNIVIAMRFKDFQLITSSTGINTEFKNTTNVINMINFIHCSKVTSKFIHIGASLPQFCSSGEIYVLCTLCLYKNIPDVFSYDLRKHYRIFIIFGRNITKKASNQKMLYFSTSPN